MDAAFKGPKYTWYNERVSRDKVKERLGRAFILVMWKVNFPDTQMVNEVAQGSIHSP